ncbi:MAG: hypothetical protein H0V95_11520 [Actinobacteria bacterium]|nr:hypothetical protein [Actinomycetota bacterium]
MDIQPSSQLLPPGTAVQVFSHFSAAWIDGFEVATNVDGGHQLRRLSDRSVVPKTFPTEDLRAQHRHRR